MAVLVWFGLVSVALTTCFQLYSACLAAHRQRLLCLRRC
jgi:hypothetical protein